MLASGSKVATTPVIEGWLVIPGPGCPTSAPVMVACEINKVTLKFCF